MGVLSGAAEKRLLTQTENTALNNDSFTKKNIRVISWDYKTHDGGMGMFRYLAKKSMVLSAWYTQYKKKKKTIFESLQFSNHLIVFLNIWQHNVNMQL